MNAPGRAAPLVLRVEETGSETEEPISTAGRSLLFIFEGHPGFARCDPPGSHSLTRRGRAVPLARLQPVPGAKPSRENEPGEQAQSPFTHVLSCRAVLLAPPGSHPQLPPSLARTDGRVPSSSDGCIITCRPHLPC